MGKDVAKCSWEENYQNKSLSGIEVKDKNGKLLGFITIKHDEILEDNTTHRIIIKVDENAEPILPPVQTFEEIIQAKRRQQMVLYGSGSSTTSNLSNRTARRVAAAARQTASAAASLQNSKNRSHVTPIHASRQSTPSKASQSQKKKKKPPPVKVAKYRPPNILVEPHGKATSTNKEESPTSSFKAPNTETHLISKPTSSAVSKSKVHNQDNQAVSPPPSTSQVPNTPGTTPTPSTSAGPSSVVTSMKAFKKHMPSLPIDTKELKLLLRSAPPGACVILSDGTIVKKSRRGGARVGAGRKRSRPLPTNSQATTTNSTSNPSN